MASRITYPLSMSFWLKDGSVTVRDTAGSLIICAPIGFLAASRDDKWAFVLECIEDCVEDQGCLKCAQGQDVNLNSPVVAGAYTYFRLDAPQLPCNYRRGPEDKRLGRAPIPGLETSTVSASSRSSPGQNRFLQALLSRDGVCLLTGAPYIDCTAAHIVPLSRPDIYEQVLGYPEQYLYQVWMGLLVSSQLHNAHDRFEWALYPREEDYVVHYFDHSFRDRKELHGKSIPFTTFRGDAHLRPRRELLLWHHRQCVQMHFRGFAHRMSAEDALAQSQLQPQAMPAGV